MTISAMIIAIGCVGTISGQVETPESQALDSIAVDGHSVDVIAPGGTNSTSHFDRKPFPFKSVRFVEESKQDLPDSRDICAGKQFAKDSENAGRPGYRCNPFEIARISKPVDRVEQTEQNPSDLQQDEPPAQVENNGTDPTLLITSFSVTSEYLSLKGSSYSNNVKIQYTQPIGKAAKNSLNVKLLIVNSNVLGNNKVGFGDLAIKWTNVTKLTKTYGIVLTGEMNFATASRTELGTGKNVFKGSFIYARFLKNRWIIAPSLQHSIALWGKSNRKNVSITVFDLYIVPKLKDPKSFVTIDPALSLDYVNRKQFGSVAVTYGRIVGKMLGGTAQITVKPSVFIGGESPGYWGVEAGIKIIGF